MDEMATFVTSVFIVKGCEFQLTDTQYEKAFFVKTLQNIVILNVFFRLFLIAALRVVILTIYIFIGTRP